MKISTLDGFTRKVTQSAKMLTSSFFENQKHTTHGFISNALLLPMLSQTFRLLAGSFLSLMAIALTAISVIYTNLKGSKK